MVTNSQAERSVIPRERSYLTAVSGKLLLLCMKIMPRREEIAESEMKEESSWQRTNYSLSPLFPFLCLREEEGEEIESKFSLSSPLYLIERGEFPPQRMVVSMRKIGG